MAPPTGPSWGECVRQREECRESIFTKMDAQHKAVLEAIGSLNKRLDFRDGKDSANDSAKLAPVQSRGGSLKRFSWEKVAAVLVIVTSAVFAGVAALKDKGMTREEIVKVVKAVLQEKGN